MNPMLQKEKQHIAKLRHLASNLVDGGWMLTILLRILLEGNREKIIARAKILVGRVEITIDRLGIQLMELRESDFKELTADQAQALYRQRIMPLLMTLEKLEPRVFDVLNTASLVAKESGCQNYAAQWLNAVIGMIEGLRQQRHNLEVWLAQLQTLNFMENGEAHRREAL